jgi:hypothetical protein
MGRATWPYRADYRCRSEGEMNPTNAIALLPEIFNHQVLSHLVQSKIRMCGAPRELA